MRERILPTNAPEQLSIYKEHYENIMQTNGNVKRWPLINGIVITEGPAETVSQENINCYSWPANSMAERVLRYPKQYGTRLEKHLREELNYIWFWLYGDIKDQGTAKLNLASFPETGSIHVQKMKECIGIDPDLYCKYDKEMWFKPIRNHAYASDNDKEWNELLRCGYAEKPESIQCDVQTMPGYACFELTSFGYTYLETVTLVSFRDWKYESLKRHGRNL